MENMNTKTLSIE